MKKLKLDSGNFIAEKFMIMTYVIYVVIVYFTESTAHMTDNAVLTAVELCAVCGGVPEGGFLVEFDGDAGNRRRCVGVTGEDALVDLAVTDSSNWRNGD